MVDGITDTLLLGRTLETDRQHLSCSVLPTHALAPDEATSPAGTPVFRIDAPVGDSAIAPGHFIVGPENQLVEVAIRSVLANPSDPFATRHYNPLVFHGPSGTGKSHVAQGIAALWKKNNRRQRVVVTTAVDFAHELNDAIESQAVDEFRKKYRTAGLLVLEDLGQLATRKSGKLNAQEEFIHTLDALVAEERWVVITASAAPIDLPGLLPALHSRLAAGLTVPLAPPGLEVRLAVLKQLAAMREIELPEPVAQVLAEGISGTVPELAGALMQLAMPNGFGAAPIDLRAARKFLAQRNNKQQPSMHEIAVATAKHFSIRLNDLKSPVRRRALVTARGVAVYLARHCGGESLEEIGRYFGGRDHTTVMHSCRRTEEMLNSDPTIHEAVERLRKELWKT